MTTLTPTAVTPHDARTSVPTVAIAGVDWPLYKLQAVVVGVMLALVVGVATGSGELTAWTLSIGTAAAWWVRRAMHSLRAEA